jgi:outer membrane immunogenic protein
MKRALLASVSVLALTLTARAADLPVRPAPIPVVAPAWTWTGFYLGINGGAVWHRAKTHITDLIPSDDFSTVKATGATFGGQAGFNWQVQQFVFGIEADWNWVDANGSSNFTVLPLIGSYSSKLSSLTTVRGRVGITMSSTMFYATGGFAGGKVNNQVPVRMGGFSDNDFKTGWTAGGGIEHMFAQHWSAKVEALYVDLGKSTVQGFFGPGYTGRFDNTAIVARAGLNYKW